MPLTNSQYMAVEREYERRRTESRLEQEARLAELEEKVPGFKEVSGKRLSLALEKSRLIPGGDAEKRRRLTEAMQALTEEKAALIRAAGYPADYAEKKPFCPHCGDTGYIGSEKCTCFRKILTDVLYHGSPLWNTVQRENFGTFDETLFGEEPLPSLGGRTARENILALKAKAEAFAEHFAETHDSLLLTGPAGTGKTFLCSCIAEKLIAGNRAVMYLSASEFFERMADSAFGEDAGQNSFEEAIFAADLLILDDLGMEVNNRFVQSALFRTVNERLLRHMSTIISTNLSLNGIDERYSERVSSRIAGHYRIWAFAGDDIRLTRAMRGRN